MCCKEAINEVDHTMATVCLILNIIWPGLGTAVNACMGKHVCHGLLVALLQVATVPLFLFGWIWSIWYGLKIVEKSKHHEEGYHHHH